MADKSLAMSIEEFRRLKRAGMLEQVVAERYGKPKLAEIVAREKARVSVAEEAFALGLRAYGLPEPVRQHRFSPPRLWRFDFCWPELMLAVEVDGVMWDRQGGHQRPDDYADDCEKLNEAVLLGWRVLRFTPAQVARGEAALTVHRALRQEKEASL